MAAHSSGGISFSRQANVTARYIAPVSRCRYPSFSATILAVVLFPDADGPSIATTVPTELTFSKSREV
jgi:hypothetical protein